MEEDGLLFADDENIHIKPSSVIPATRTNDFSLVRVLWMPPRGADPAMVERLFLIPVCRQRRIF